MKKLAILMLLSLCSFNSYSQIKFEKGYFITNNNEKIECLIKNVDWVNNPTKFEYKLDTKSKVLSIEDAKEFSIPNFVKYKRFVVDIDKSTERLDRLGYEGKPKFQKETLFLREIIEGKASLYSYVGKGIRTYFYTIDSKNIKQLIHIKYKQNNKIKINNTYKQQLWADVKCDAITINDIRDITYIQEKLINYFIKYNTCHNSEFTQIEVKRKRKWFNLTPRIGLSNVSTSLDKKATTNVLIFSPIRQCS